MSENYLSWYDNLKPGDEVLAWSIDGARKVVVGTAYRKLFYDAAENCYDAACIAPWSEELETKINALIDQIYELVVKAELKKMENPDAD